MAERGSNLHATEDEERAPADRWIDRRRLIRQTTVLQVAKLIIGRFEELCIIRDVSSHGLKATVYCPIPVGREAVIELRTGYRACGRIAWCDDDHIGLAFDPCVSPSNLLIHCSLDERIGRIRPARLHVCLPARLTIDGEVHRVELRDISLAGMKIRVAHPLLPDTECTITPDAMEPRSAVVRWYRGGKAGLQLDEPLSFDRFAEWRRALAERPRRLWIID